MVDDVLQVLFGVQRVGALQVYLERSAAGVPDQLLYDLQVRLLALTCLLMLPAEHEPSECIWSILEPLKKSPIFSDCQAKTLNDVPNYFHRFCSAKHTLRHLGFLDRPWGKSETRRPSLEASLTLLLTNMEMESHLFVEENGLHSRPFSTFLLVSQSVDFFRTLHSLKFTWKWKTTCL